MGTDAEFLHLSVALMEHFFKAIVLLRNWYILTQMINTILLFRFLTHCEKRTTIIKFISGL